MSALRLSRRGLFGGFAALLAAPAIVRVASIMPVARVPDEAALYRLLDERLKLATDRALAEMDRVWNEIIYGDGSGPATGGLADLLAAPDSLPIADQCAQRTYQRYSGYVTLDTVPT